MEKTQSGGKLPDFYKVLYGNLHHSVQNEVKKKKKKIPASSL